jgi:hypothetical protein
MPTLSASDYTSFIKAQAASQSYRNGAVPTKIQTSDQPFATQSVLNAQMLTSQAAYFLTPSKVVVDTLETTISAASSTIITGAAGGGDSVIYTTSVPHGLTTSDTVTITGITGFANANITDAEVLETLTPTTFRARRFEAGFTEVIGQTARIVGFVHYTTAAAHGFSTNTRNISISGLTTSAFNLSLVNVSRVPSSTVFVIATSANGTAVTSASGVINLTRYPNPNATIVGNARIRPYDGIGYVNNPKSLVTLTQSGTLSSSKTQQVGGLPTTAPKGSGVYAPTPQLARVNTRSTGAYKAVRSPV